MPANKRRRLTMAELTPGIVTLFLVSGDMETSEEGYILREGMTVVEAVYVWRHILRDGLEGLSPTEPYRLVSFEKRLRDHGSIEIVLPDREGRWPA